MTHDEVVKTNEHIVALAEKLAEITPGRLRESVFCRLALPGF